MLFKQVVNFGFDHAGAWDALVASADRNGGDLGPLPRGQLKYFYARRQSFSESYFT